MKIHAVSAVDVPPLSQSRFEMMACAHLYTERVVKGVREPDNQYAERGRQFHEGAADYADHLVSTRKSSDPEWFEREVLSRSQWLPEALELLAFFGEHFQIDPEKVLGAEMYLAMDADFKAVDPLEQDGPWEYEGTLDLVQVLDETRAVIDDYKTFWRIEDADSFQSAFYPLLLFKAMPSLQEIEFRLNFVRYNVPRSRKFTSEDIPKLQKMAREARQRQLLLHSLADAPVPDAHPAATPGAFCAYCPKLQKGCPIADINPYTNQSPEDRLKFAIWVNEAKKQNDRILKDLVDAQGPICIADANGRGYQAEFELQHRGSYSATVLPVVSANDPELVERLTVGGLSNWLKAKKRMGLKALCDAHRTEKAITKFTIHGVDLAEDADGSAEAAD